MKFKTRIIGIVTAASIVLSFLTACGGENKNQTVPYDSEAADSTPSAVAAANSDYELLWENEAKCVMLKSVATGKIWSAIPYEYYLSSGSSANVNSTLNITVSNSQTLKWDTVNGYSEAFLDGRITCSKIEDGLKVTYYFDKFKISVPVAYRLRSDSLEISIDPSEISEGEEYLLVSVAPTPFLCASANSDTDSYLFVPTGSGALMYTDVRADGDRLYQGELYGEDGSRLLTSPEAAEEPIRLPVYGVRDKDNALLGIIESGAEAAVLNAAAGNDRTGYSNIYSSFYLRSYDKVASGIQSLNYEDIIKVSEKMSAEPIKIGYYPLTGKAASYTGMANRYKTYLTDNGLLNKAAVSESRYGVNIIGGTLKSSTVLGMPGEVLDVMTTFSQAKEIIAKLTEISDMKPEIMLTGFGNNGINPGKIAGGYNFSSDFGNKKQYKELQDYCSNNKLNIYTDFDIIRYSSSSIGFNYIFDAAKSPSLQAVEKSPVQVPLGTYDDRTEYRLVKRSKLQKAVDKLISEADGLSLSGVGLSSLSSIAYSDYSEVKYYSKGNMSNDVSLYIGQLRDAKHKVGVSEANAYAAAAGDAIFNAPANNGGYNVFDACIPFYEMVFSGSKPIYGSAVNTAADFRKQIMLSMIGGAGLSFTLAYDFEAADLEFQSEKLYAAEFNGNVTFIKETLEKYAHFYSATAGSGISDYEISKSGISKTVFDNGVILYANHNPRETESQIGKLEAYGVRWINEQ